MGYNAFATYLPLVVPWRNKFFVFYFYKYYIYIHIY